MSLQTGTVDSESKVTIEAKVEERRSSSCEICFKCALKQMGNKNAYFYVLKISAKAIYYFPTCKYFGYKRDENTPYGIQHDCPYKLEHTVFKPRYVLTHPYDFGFVKKMVKDNKILIVRKSREFEFYPISNKPELYELRAYHKYLFKEQMGDEYSEEDNTLLREIQMANYEKFDSILDL